MLPDRVSNPGPLTYESGALPIALRGPAIPSMSLVLLCRVQMVLTLQTSITLKLKDKFFSANNTFSISYLCFFSDTGYNS